MSYVPPLRHLLLRGIVGLAVLLLAGYGAFEGRRLIEGPQISIVLPRDGSAVPGPLIHVAGVAHNVAFLTINSKQAFVDQSDHFDEALSPPSGYTVLTVSGKDRFGRSQTKSIQITLLNYCPVHT